MARYTALAPVLRPLYRLLGDFALALFVLFRPGWTMQRAVERRARFAPLVVWFAIWVMIVLPIVLQWVFYGAPSKNYFDHSQRLAMACSGLVMLPVLSLVMSRATRREESHILQTATVVCYATAPHFWFSILLWVAWMLVHETIFTFLEGSWLPAGVGVAALSFFGLSLDHLPKTLNLTQFSYAPALLTLWSGYLTAVGVALMSDWGWRRVALLVGITLLVSNVFWFIVGSRLMYFIAGFLEDIIRRSLS